MREKPRNPERLAHILNAITNIFEFVENVTYEQFKQEKMRQFAIAKNLEIIGEAAYHLTQDLIENNPHVEWKKIMGLRHVLVHEYYHINLELIWNVIENKLTNLQVQITEIKAIIEKNIT